jgi:L-lactate dehydrogenase complex protein LldG
MNETRRAILQRLRRTRLPSHEIDRVNKPSAADRDIDGLIARFTERQQAVRGEVHRMPRGQWLNWLAVELPGRGLRHVLTGTGEIGRQLAATHIRGLRLHTYDEPIEDWKRQLFEQVDVAITGARCGIAETGSLVLWPDAQEPRLMSLVPPVHVALLSAYALYPTLAEALQAENWAGRMPTNVLLISGPSKTADIEQTLAYGIHGPKSLITLILE